MSFADPQSVTVNAVAISLPRTSSGVNSGVFTSAWEFATVRLACLWQANSADDPP